MEEFVKRFLACVLLAFAATAIAMAADVSGKWTGSLTPENGDAQSALLVLKQDGAVITGTAGPDENQQFPIQTGKVDGNKIVIEIAPTEGTLYHLELVLDGDHMKGDLTAKRDDQTMTAKLDLARAK
jgi:opacity protein-like surface antigen